MLYAEMQWPEAVLGMVVCACVAFVVWVQGKYKPWE